MCRVSVSCLFPRVRSFPNDFWGWGGEDDAFYNRAVQVGANVSRPAFGYFTLLDHASPAEELRNGRKKACILRDLEHWRSNGLSDVRYTVTSHAREEHVSAGRTSGYHHVVVDFPDTS